MARFKTIPVPYAERCVRLAVLCASASLLSCHHASPGPTMTAAPKPQPQAIATFASDVAFMKEHTPLIILKSDDSLAQLAIAPAYQGRVMTSTATGADGSSYGYVHRTGVAAGARQPHITVLGGEDRFWLGPEGGQYALYFAPGASFDLEHWQVPEPIDWGAWPVVARSAREVTFAREMTLRNYAGTAFHVRVERTVRLLDSQQVIAALGVALPEGVRAVGYESDNRITNIGTQPWRKATGLLSIWILGMFKPAPRVTVVLPYLPGPPGEHGAIVNDAYFGAIGKDRLVTGENAVFFRGDGRSRGKIGLPQRHARAAIGSYDADAQSLTLVQYTLPEAPAEYVNSLWQVQANPYSGDVVNSYNDGPPADGAPPLGPFYELESSSPAAALAKGESLRHVHRTFHLQAEPAALDVIARKQLGVPLSSIASALEAR